MLEDCKKVILLPFFFSFALSFTNTHFPQALELDPNNVKGYVRRGKALTELDDWEAAKAAFAKATKIDPNNPDVKREQARLLKKIADQTAKEKKVYGGMFDKLSKMDS